MMIFAGFQMFNNRFVKNSKEWTFKIILVTYYYNITYYWENTLLYSIHIQYIHQLWLNLNEEKKMSQWKNFVLLQKIAYVSWKKAWPNKKEDDVYIWKQKRLTENWPDKFRQVLLNMQNGVCWPLLLCWKLFVRHDIQRIKVVIDPPLNLFVYLF